MVKRKVLFLYLSQFQHQLLSIYSRYGVTNLGKAYWTDVLIATTMQTLPNATSITEVRRRLLFKPKETSPAEKNCEQTQVDVQVELKENKIEEGRSSNAGIFIIILYLFNF